MHNRSAFLTSKHYDITDIERLMGKRDWKSYDDVIAPQSEVR